MHKLPGRSWRTRPGSWNCYRHGESIAYLIQYNTLSKSIFGHLQNAQFPPYFAISAATTLFLTMGVAALVSLLNLFWAGPVTTKVMLDRKDLVKKNQPVPEEMNRKFSILHGVSSLLNLRVVGAVVKNCFWVGLWFGSK
ncbi:hypothetical protein CcCBS67573_g07363 [Chytriomyces confervae]|uniref:DUF4149 domain-containing protein n=1 Tax=Chytriomyces confervae TaxID=246404 RepID=A0A507EVC8_9FUNG|nr:hypothetical protein CcCBS67573_g07363 [Chytriomyces confervae]